MLVSVVLPAPSLINPPVPLMAPDIVPSVAVSMVMPAPPPAAVAVVTMLPEPLTLPNVERSLVDEPIPVLLLIVPLSIKL